MWGDGFLVAQAGRPYDAPVGVYDGGRCPAVHSLVVARCWGVFRLAGWAHLMRVIPNRRPLVPVPPSPDTLA